MDHTKRLEKTIPRLLEEAVAYLVSNHASIQCQDNTQNSLKMFEIDSSFFQVWLLDQSSANPQVISPLHSSAHSWSCEVRMCYLVTFFNWTPLLEWGVVMYGSKNLHHKDIWFKETRLHPRFILTTPQMHTKRLTQRHPKVIASVWNNTYPTNHSIQLIITSFSDYHFTISHFESIEESFYP